MTLTKRLRERAWRWEAYQRACMRGAALLARYDQTGEDVRELAANTILLDRLYLAWYETYAWAD